MYQNSVRPLFWQDLQVRIQLQIVCVFKFEILTSVKA